MDRAMCMAVTLMLASVVAQANQCSSGGERPSDDGPQNLVSVLQTKLQVNMLEDGPSVMTNPSAMPTELKGMVHSGETPAFDLVEAGSDSTRLSTCFPKEVDVCFDECFDNSVVCKPFRKSSSLEANTLHLSYDPDSRTLCITDDRKSRTQTRALSTVHMITDAVRSLDKKCESLSPFQNKVIFVHDVSNCSHDMAYSARTWTNGCKTKLIPDFSFYKWTEAGLLPDYKHLAPVLASLGSHPATEDRCGWAGNLATNSQRVEFRDKFNGSALFDIVTPWCNSCPSGQGGRISLEDQVKRWPCFVELPGFGYSGRIPYLLQSGRPILLVEPGPCPACGGEKPGPLVPTWFSHLLKPWVHYIPVKQDMSDLAEKAKFALGITEGSNATKIAAAAQEFAQTHLSYDAAINHLADSLVGLQQAA